VWAMDWMFDELFDGRRLWVLTVIDTWSRVCPVMRVDVIPRNWSACG